MSFNKIHPFAAGLAFALLALGAGNKIASNKAEAQAKAKVNEFSNMTLPVYNKIERGVESGRITYQQALDSLKTDSIAQKAYFEGAQMVRDSLTAAAKVKF